MILFLKRILADIIDALLFCLVYSLFFLTSGFSSTGGHRVFFISVTAIFVLFAPAVLIKNTVGKEILNIRYSDTSILRIKLFLKYFFYIVLLLPSINPLSIAISFPYYNKDIINPDETFLFKLTVAYVICDVAVIIFSSGKFRIIDYFLKLRLADAGFIKSTYKSLSIILSYFTILIILDVLQYRYAITFSDIAKNLNSKVSKESFPVDLVHGGAILSLHEMSNEVFVPTKPLTLIYQRRLPLKTIYIYMPYEKFRSDIERMETCYSVLTYSLRNDMYSDYEPALTRIIVTSSENAFLSYKQYKYFYYFDKNLPEWGIYGGIKADSTTTRHYINVLNNVLAGKHNRIEKKYNLPLEKILFNSEMDSTFKQKVLSEYSSSSYETSYTYGGISMLIDTSELQLKKIRFEEAKLYGVQHFNFPINRQPEYSFFIQDFEEKSFIEDENVTQMQFIINTYSDTHL